MLSAIYHPSTGPTKWAVHPQLISLWAQAPWLVEVPADHTAVRPQCHPVSVSFWKCWSKPSSPPVLTASMSSPAWSMPDVSTVGPRVLSYSPFLVSKFRGLCSAARLPGLEPTLCPLTLISCVTLGRSPYPFMPQVLQL